MNSIKQIYKLLQRNERTIKPVKVSSVKRSQFRLYARILAAGKK